MYKAGIAVSWVRTVMWWILQTIIFHSYWMSENIFAYSLLYPAPAFLVPLKTNWKSRFKRLGIFKSKIVEPLKILFMQQRSKNINNFRKKDANLLDFALCKNLTFGSCRGQSSPLYEDDFLWVPVLSFENSFHVRSL